MLCFCKVILKLSSVVTFTSEILFGLLYTTITYIIFRVVSFFSCDSCNVFKFRLLNSAFITRLPKKVDAVEIKIFRPISLIHSFAKLVTKLMANRLAPLLPSLVSANQSAFVRGRRIHDNFMLVQQMVKSLHKKKEAHILLKLDISKAFDSVSWSFLLEVLRKVGFGQRWRDLICLILSTSSTQILVNGEPGDTIYRHRGLRQGDPLLQCCLF